MTHEFARYLLAAPACPMAVTEMDAPLTARPIGLTSHQYARTMLRAPRGDSLPAMHERRMSDGGQAGTGDLHARLMLVVTLPY